ncbi:hypothetical protein NM208_g12419 [Fusarium decemcellulare]|uniref:Uncharacterized protein n=1 Tax=Fusarium decemcellulare TaxID=57161 RepID=A0ACC1RNP0_9HYPO|nr:hypothetical protein NM208_g12419 [Fusarium decemcellulare]
MVAGRSGGGRSVGDESWRLALAPNMETSVPEAAYRKHVVSAFHCSGPVPVPVCGFQVPTTLEFGQFGGHPEAIQRLESRRLPVTGSTCSRRVALLFLPRPRTAPEFPKLEPFSTPTGPPSVDEATDLVLHGQPKSFSGGVEILTRPM